MYKTICSIFFYLISIFLFSQNEEIDNETKTKKEVAIITFGLFEGGGLVGFNVEYGLINNFGIQAGVGLLGYEAGLNFHFKNKIRSSYFSLQYINQGLNKTFVQSIIAGSYVYRGKKNLSTRAGLGVINEIGPLSPYKRDNIPDLVFMISIGLYLPIIR